MWKKNLFKWRLVFLLDIKNKEWDIKSKLHKISELWADFNYPKEWRKFIYYMPLEEDDTSEKLGEDAVYSNFLNYLEKNVKIF